MQVSREMCSRQSALCWRKDFFIMLTPIRAVPSTSGEVSSQAFPHCQGDSHTRADMLHAEIVSWEFCSPGFCWAGCEHTGLSCLWEHQAMLRAFGHLRGHGDRWQMACVPHNTHVQHVCLPNNDKLLTLAKQTWYSLGALLLRKINPSVTAHRDKRDRMTGFHW